VCLSYLEAEPEEEESFLLQVYFIKTEKIIRVFNFWKDEHHENTDMIILKKLISRILTRVKKNDTVLCLLLTRIDPQDILLSGKGMQTDACIPFILKQNKTHH
jgi:hypothetical protein